MTKAQAKERGRKWKRTHLANRKRQKLEPTIPYKGDNFRFVAWGGLADLRLWHD